MQHDAPLVFCLQLCSSLQQSLADLLPTLRPMVIGKSDDLMSCSLD